MSSPSRRGIVNATRPSQNHCVPLLHELAWRVVKKSQSKELTLRSLQEVKRCEIGIVMGAGDASTDGKGWVLSDEQKLKLQSAFCSIDANQDGTVDDSERRAARGLLNAVKMEFGLGPEVSLDGTMTYEEFEERFVREWVVAQKQQALSDLELIRAVAELLPGGTPEAPLAGLRDLSTEALESFCRHALPDRVMSLLKDKQAILQQRYEGTVVGAEQGNCKFGEAVLRKARFGGMEDFTKGLVGKIGVPDARLMLALELEHCMRGDSKDEFSPGNYDTITTPATEWRVVTVEEESKRVSAGPRQVLSLEAIKQLPRVQEVGLWTETNLGGLRDEEILALLLYTGLHMLKRDQTRSFTFGVSLVFPGLRCVWHHRGA
jgi:hypothetical protein